MQGETFDGADFGHTAELLRSGDEAVRSAAASNNHNIILAALDLAANRLTPNRRADTYAVPYESKQSIDALPEHLIRIAHRDYSPVNEGYWILYDASLAIVLLRAAALSRARGEPATEQS